MVKNDLGLGENFSEDRLESAVYRYRTNRIGYLLAAYGIAVGVILTVSVENPGALVACSMLGLTFGFFAHVIMEAKILADLSDTEKEVVTQEGLRVERLPRTERRKAESKLKIAHERYTSLNA